MPSSNMLTTAQIYRSPRLAIKCHQLRARGNRHRHRLALSSKKTEPVTPVGVSPKTAEAYGRYLNITYAEAVQEILLITQACLMPLGKSGDF